MREAEREREWTSHEIRGLQKTSGPMPDLKRNIFQSVIFEPYSMVFFLHHHPFTAPLGRSMVKWRNLWAARSIHHQTKRQFGEIFSHFFRVVIPTPIQKHLEFPKKTHTHTHNNLDENITNNIFFPMASDVLQTPSPLVQSVYKPTSNSTFGSLGP